MNATTASAVLLAASLAIPAAGQLYPPNANGVSLSHIHLYVSDVAAQQKFWVLMGGVPVANEKLEMIQFPGVFILLRNGQTKGGPAGSIVNHFGFVWKDLPAAMAKWKAAGYQIEQGDKPDHGFVLGPDGIRLEFAADPSLTVPVAMNHIHLYPQDVAAMRAWYVKVFGAVPDNLTMSPGDTKLDTTAGRSLDHIGLEIKDLPALLDRIKAQGIPLTQELTPSRFSSKLRVAFITDPWGTKIELTQGIAP